MAGKQINFTKKTIEALPAPTKSVRAYYHDTKETGLSVSITRAGSKTFFVRKRIDGADERITLGRYPIPDEWKPAWQSIMLLDGMASPSGTLQVPAPWQRPELWSE